MCVDVHVRACVHVSVHMCVLVCVRVSVCILEIKSRASHIGGEYNRATAQPLLLFEILANKVDVESGLQKTA